MDEDTDEARARERYIALGIIRPAPAPGSERDVLRAQLCEDHRAAQLAERERLRIGARVEWLAVDALIRPRAVDEGRQPRGRVLRRGGALTLPPALARHRAHGGMVR